MSAITAEQQQSIAAFLKDKHIPQGLGTKEEACSIAAINLALNGEMEANPWVWAISFRRVEQ